MYRFFLYTLKTDNSPSYMSAAFQMFCKTFNIALIMGIFYNPKGHLIVKHAYHMLKIQLQPQNKRILPYIIYISY